MRSKQSAYCRPRLKVDHANAKTLDSDGHDGASDDEILGASHFEDNADDDEDEE